MFQVLAAIPSPSSSSVHFGPLRVTAYGVMIGLGVLAAVWLAGRRLVSRGAGTTDDMSSIAMWGVAGGLIGARLYHVGTDWDRFASDFWLIPQLWRGGLGIPGGLVGGVAVGLWAARRRGISAPLILDVVAPAIPLAQAIGRWGNWWNQELFGRPTKLPWALEIDDSKIPAGYELGTTFHPTFLYESVWNLALCALLIAIDHRTQLRPGRLFALYLGGYFTGRFWVEGLRIDSAPEIAGLRWNQWVSLAVVCGVGTLFIVDAIRRRDGVESGTAIDLESPRV